MLNSSSRNMYLIRLGIHSHHCYYRGVEYVDHHPCDRQIRKRFTFSAVIDIMNASRTCSHGAPKQW